MGSLITKRKLSLLTIILFLTIVGGIKVVSANSMYTELCKGTDCRGKDPIAYQCYNVTNAAYSYYPDNSSWVIFTELRKSADCNSYWPRATKSSSYSGNWMLTEALECANNTCVFTSETPPPNPSSNYYYYPWTGNQHTAYPSQASKGTFYGDMVSATKHSCARGWTYTSAPTDYVTNSNVYRSWACN